MGGREDAIEHERVAHALTIGPEDLKAMLASLAQHEIGHHLRRKSPKLSDVGDTLERPLPRNKNEIGLVAHPKASSAKAPGNELLRSLTVALEDVAHFA
mgnify:FL=1